MPFCFLDRAPSPSVWVGIFRFPELVDQANQELVTLMNYVTGAEDKLLNGMAQPALYLTSYLAARH